MPSSAPPSAPATASQTRTTDAAASKTAPREPLIKQVLSSTTIWIVAILLLVDFGLAQWRPLRYVSLKYIPVDQNPIVSKVPEFFNAQAPADVLIVGSSLPMTAFALADDLFKKDLGEGEINIIRTYTKSNHLSALLRDQLHKSFSCFNLACIGCMVSDTHLLVRRALDAGKKPKLLIYGIAPRDFVDNVAQPIGKTPCYEVLSDWRCLGDLSQGKLSPEEIRDMLISCLWYYYRVKVDYKTFFMSLTCDAMARPMSLYDAAKAGADAKAGGQAPALSAPDQLKALPKSAPACPVAPINMTSAATDERFADSIAEYQSRYNPPNKTRFAQENAYFGKILELCQNSGVPVLLINMPITEENKRLLDPALYQQYLDNLRQMAGRYGVKFYDAQVQPDGKNAFPLAMFSDSVHLNREGSRKFQQVLLDEMQRQAVVENIQ